MILFHIFHEFLEDISEDVLPNERTGYQESLIWNRLYSFQKDAATGIINKLETYNGCILADSVGRLSLEEHTSLVKLKDAAIAQSHSRFIEPDSAANALNHAEQHLFERKTVTKDHELFTEALRHSRGEVDLVALRGKYEFEVSRGTYLQTGGNVATEYSLQRERAMVAVVNEGIGHYPRLGGNEQPEVSASLREEQRRAVEVILDSRDLAVNFRGAAGTGKT